MNIGEKLALYRKRSNHTHDSLSRSSGVSIRRIAQIEKNIGSPSVDNLEKMLAACGVTLAEFFRAPHVAPSDPVAQDALEKLDLILRDPKLRDCALILIQLVFQGLKHDPVP